MIIIIVIKFFFSSNIHYASRSYYTVQRKMTKPKIMHIFFFLQEENTHATMIGQCKTISQQVFHFESKIIVPIINHEVTLTHSNKLDQNEGHPPRNCPGAGEGWILQKLLNFTVWKVLWRMIIFYFIGAENIAVFHTHKTDDHFGRFGSPHTHSCF